jgi:hypothetical protein
MKFHTSSITNTATEKILEVTAVKFNVEDYLLHNEVLKKVIGMTGINLYN